MIASTHKLALAAALALPLTLGGCGAFGSANRSLDSIHQPVVTQTNLALDLTPSGGSLPLEEQKRLVDWFDAMGVGYGDRVAVDDPDPYGNSQALAEIARQVERRGMLVTAAAPVTTGVVRPGTIRVVVSRSVAEVPSCPDWSTRSATDFSGGTSANYGCAINSNLAAMIADPQDLIQGRGGQSRDPLTAAKAIQSYRDQAPTGTRGLTNTTTRGDN